MIVMKFGGTSVGDSDCIRNAAGLVRAAAETHGPVVVVVSAMSGVTNALIDAAFDAARGERDTWMTAKDELLERHRNAVLEVASDVKRGIVVLEQIEHLLDNFANLCNSIAVLGELTPRGLDVVSSFGERMSVGIVAEALRKDGVRAEAIASTELVITDNNFGNASPRMDLTRQRCRERLLPLLENGIVPVVTGFIGATEDGVITTLGRGGSDYSAAILARCLDADDLWIWGPTSTA